MTRDEMDKIRKSVTWQERMFFDFLKETEPESIHSRMTLGRVKRKIAEKQERVQAFKSQGKSFADGGYVDDRDAPLGLPVMKEGRITCWDIIRGWFR